MPPAEDLVAGAFDHHDVGEATGGSYVSNQAGHVDALPGLLCGPERCGGTAGTLAADIGEAVQVPAVQVVNGSVDEDPEAEVAADWRGQDMQAFHDHHVRTAKTGARAGHYIGEQMAVRRDGQVLVPGLGTGQEAQQILVTEGAREPFTVCLAAPGEFGIGQEEAVSADHGHVGPCWLLADQPSQLRGSCRLAGCDAACDPDDERRSGPRRPDGNRAGQSHQARARWQSGVVRARARPPGRS